MKEELLRMARRKRLVKQRTAVETEVTKLMGPGNYDKYRDNLGKIKQARNVADLLSGLPTTVKLSEIEDPIDGKEEILLFVRIKGSTADVVSDIVDLTAQVIGEMETANHKLACTPKIRLKLDEIVDLTHKIEDHD